MCFSIYSLISKRSMALSSPKSSWAKALASSVLPTPVGPRKRKEPTGRFLSLKPARARRIALLTACTASFCPMTRLVRRASSSSSLALSLSVSLASGMPVQEATTSATSSAVTGIDFATSAKAAASCFCSSFSLSRSLAACS